MAYLVAVGFGGFVGAVLRYAITGWMQHRFPHFPPAGTLAVNVLGCFVIGFLMTLIVDQPAGDAAWIPHSLRLFLITGILGSLTTFSTFGYETVELFREEEIRSGLWNIAGNMGLGLPAVWLGRLIAKAVGL